jgi:predicted flap endonuclease-1-like 5' DNA nuclease
MFRKRKVAAWLSRTGTRLLRRRFENPWKRARKRLRLIEALLLGLLFVWWFFRWRDMDNAGRPRERHQTDQTTYPYPSYQREAPTPQVSQTPLAQRTPVDARIDAKAIASAAVEAPHERFMNMTGGTPYNPPVHEAEHDTPPEATPEAAPQEADGEVSLADTQASHEPPTPDDLTMLEGVGPKVAELLHENGIMTFAQVADADVEHLRQILRDAGLPMIKPDTWPEQARLAAEGQHEKLKYLQSELRAGRRES